MDNLKRGFCISKKCKNMKLFIAPFSICRKANLMATLARALRGHSFASAL